MIEIRAIVVEVKEEDKEEVKEIKEIQEIKGNKEILEVQGNREDLDLDRNKEIMIEESIKIESMGKLRMVEEWSKDRIKIEIKINL